MSSLYVTSGDAYANERRLVVTVAETEESDLTGVTLTFMVKDRRSDDDADALIVKTTEDGIEIASPQTGDTAGVAYIEIAEADTAELAGRYYWELEATDSIGALTLARGSMYIGADLVTGAADLT